MKARVCLACGQPLVKREKEAESNFLKRKNCNKQCAAKSKGKQCDKAHTYPSRFGGGWLTAAQYLTENICDRSARKSGLVLPHRFWDFGQWKDTFFLQLRYVNKLLKKYSVEAIIAALRTPQGKRVVSFGGSWFEPIIHNEQEKIRRAQERAEQANSEPIVTEPLVAEKPRDPFVPSKSTLEKLKGL